MSTRFVVVIVALAASVVCCIASYSGYQEFFKCRSEVLETASKINENANKIADLEEQFEQIRGVGAPRTLKDVVGFVSQHEDVEIVEIKSFNVKGDGLEILGNVTSLSDTTLCDGFEVTVTSQNLMEFAKYIDSGSLTFHSVDFFFGSKTAVLRARIGGGLRG